MGTDLRDDGINIKRIVGRNRHRRSRGNARETIKFLGTRLVDSRCARPYARPDIRKADRLQEALDHTIFPFATMQAKKRYVEVAINQSNQIFFLGRIEALDRKPRLLQCRKGTFS